MEPLAIIVAQIFTVMIMCGLRESGLLLQRGRAGRAALGLEMMFVPPLLTLTDRPSPVEVDFAAGILVLLAMIFGFCIFRNSLHVRNR